VGRHRRCGAFWEGTQAAVAGYLMLTSTALLDVWIHLIILENQCIFMRYIEHLLASSVVYI
jgi:hypothetical protein